MRQATAADFGMEKKRAPHPIIAMSVRQFEALPEYSATMPTGTVPGKMWRRHDGAHDPRCKNPVWYVLQFGAISADGKSIGLHWFRPVLSREMTDADIGWPQPDTVASEEAIALYEMKFFRWGYPPGAWRAWNGIAASGWGATRGEAIANFLAGLVL